ncbi:MAG: hypothetical protein NC221_03495 [Duncaniella sp.]|nr:hypothetical protein [Muribaculum sp.]MCM1255166.1 hypothetical protein [Duncaniella sp.]
MNALSQIFIVAIIFGSIYKVIELFVRRRERMMLIEKITSESAENLDLSKIANCLTPQTDNRFTALKWGAFAVGLGLGLLISSLIVSIGNTSGLWTMQNNIIGACVLLGGGLGLLAAFLIENSIRKSQRGERAE